MDYLERMAKRLKEFYPPSLTLPGVLEKMTDYNITEEEILKTYRTGKLFREKSRKPDMIGIVCYDGKKKRTIGMVVRLMKDFAKVVTAWVEPGKP